MRVLLVEDEAVLRAQLKQMLEQAGYAVDEAADGQTALHLGTTEPYDAVVLDLGLPVLDGLTVLQRWRSQGRAMPVLILTARDSWHEKVAGIDAGADDYLAKPFHTEELLARLRALVRRSHGLASPLLRHADITLDTRTSTVAQRGVTVSLTAHEYRLLAYLMHRAGQVVSRAELVEHLYAQDFDRDSNTVEVFVGRLRRKLGAALIETVRGMGYRLAPEP
jgi:two-component system OmpR family response regulator